MWIVNYDQNNNNNKKKRPLQISPSPCQFGRGWASSHCRSAIWSPLLADSCKATHVRVTRTRWCCEDRGALRVSALDCLVKRIKPLSSKYTYWGITSPSALTLSGKISITVHHPTQWIGSTSRLTYSWKQRFCTVVICAKCAFCGLILSWTFCLEPISSKS